MTFSTATPEMAPALKALWSRVFGDPDDYIDFFFENCFSAAETMVAHDNSTPFSMLFLLPMEVRAGEISYPARYVYAVATAPEMRSQGLSGALLRETHRVLRERGIALSLLVPASESLFGYYAARGYRTEFYERVIRWQGASDGETLPLIPTDCAAQRAVRDRFFSDCVRYGAYDEAALSYRGAENDFLGGTTLAFSQEGQDGYAVCLPQGDTVLVRELAGEPNETLLRSIARYFDCPRVQVRCPGGEGDKPFAMTCWYTQEPPALSGRTALSLVLD